MKVTSNAGDRKFEPVVLNITLESLEEAKMMFSLFNYAPMCALLKLHGINSEAIRDAIVNVSGHLDYGKIFFELSDAIRLWG